MENTLNILGFDVSIWVLVTLALCFVLVIVIRVVFLKIDSRSRNTIQSNIRSQGDVVGGDKTTITNGKKQ